MNRNSSFSIHPTKGSGINRQHSSEKCVPSSSSFFFFHSHPFPQPFDPKSTYFSPPTTIYTMTHFFPPLYFLWAFSPFKYNPFLKKMIEEGVKEGGDFLFPSQKNPHPVLAPPSLHESQRRIVCSSPSIVPLWSKQEDSRARTKGDSGGGGQ